MHFGPWRMILAFLMLSPAALGAAPAQHMAIPALCARILAAAPSSMYIDLAPGPGGEVSVRPSDWSYSDGSYIPPLPTPVESVSLADARALLDLFENLGPLACAITDEGCEGRAMAMTWLMEQMGIESRKIYAMSGGEEMYGLSRHGAKLWNYHVAPVIRVRGPRGGLPVDMVLDPALAENPITVPQWLSFMGRKTAHPLLGTYIDAADFPEVDPVDGPENGLEGAVTFHHFVTERFDSIKNLGSPPPRGWMAEHLTFALGTLNRAFTYLKISDDK